MHQPPLKPPPCHHHHYIVWQQHHFISHYKIYIKQINQLVKLVNTHTLIWCLLLAIGWFVVAGDDYVVLLDISFYRCNVPRTENYTTLFYIFHCQWFRRERGNVYMLCFSQLKMRINDMYNWMLWWGWNDNDDWYDGMIQLLIIFCKHPLYICNILLLKHSLCVCVSTVCWHCRDIGKCSGTFLFSKLN